MILFLFVIMMVQIHLMPVTTSIAPRIQDGDTSARPSDLALTCGLNQFAGVDHRSIPTALGAISSPLNLRGASTGQSPSLLSLGATSSHDPVGDHTTPRSLIISSRKGVHTPFLSFQILQMPLQSQYLYTLINPRTIGYGGGNMIVNYFFPSWFIEFKTMTDLETLANILYQGYPSALILIGVALWAVLIGIIKVTASKV